MNRKTAYKPPRAVGLGRDIPAASGSCVSGSMVRPAGCRNGPYGTMEVCHEGFAVNPQAICARGAFVQEK